MHPTYNTIPQTGFMGECMKGTIGYYKGSYYVRWYDSSQGKTIKIYHYKGEKIRHEKTAQKLLSVMQSDVENGTFYLDKYTKRNFSDIIPFIETWLENVKDDLSPATYKGYKSYIKNHIKPFFLKHSQLTLPDIQIDVLRELKRSLKNKNGKPLSPKMKMNVMYCISRSTGVGTQNL